MQKMRRTPELTNSLFYLLARVDDPNHTKKYDLCKGVKKPASSFNWGNKRKVNLLKVLNFLSYDKPRNPLYPFCPGREKQEKAQLDQEKREWMILLGRVDYNVFLIVLYLRFIYRFQETIPYSDFLRRSNFLTTKKNLAALRTKLHKTHITKELRAVVKKLHSDSVHRVKTLDTLLSQLDIEYSEDVCRKIIALGATLDKYFHNIKVRSVGFTANFFGNYYKTRGPLYFAIQSYSHGFAILPANSGNVFSPWKNTLPFIENVCKIHDTPYALENHTKPDSGHAQFVESLLSSMHTEGKWSANPSKLIVPPREKNQVVDEVNIEDSFWFWEVVLFHCENVKYESPWSTGNPVPDCYPIEQVAKRR